MGSKNVTVTQYRGFKAFQDMVESSEIIVNGSSTNNNIDEKVENMKVRVGEVERFYPSVDKVLVKFNDNTRERCVMNHLVVSNEVNISWTPVGDTSIDTTYNDFCVIPVNKFYVLVMSIRDTDNEKENAVIGFISKDDQIILDNAYTGELKLQYYDSSILLKQDGIEFKAKSFKWNDKEVTNPDMTQYTNTTDLNTLLSSKVDKTEMETQLKSLNDRITALEDKGT
jgi:hypothetical protein